MCQNNLKYNRGINLQLRCNGTKVDVELEGNNVNFDRVLLYREEKQTVRIHNKSTISIFWLLKTIEELNSQIAFSPNRGSIKPKESGTVDVTLHASKVQKNTIFINTLQELFFNIKYDRWVS